MSYDLNIRSDWWGSIAAPPSQVLLLLNRLPGVIERYPGTFDVPLGKGRTSVKLVVDEVDEEGNSLDILRRQEAGEPYVRGTVPERCNLISASITYGFEESEYLEFMAILWGLADSLGWRLLDNQVGRFVRPRYDTQVFLPPAAPAGEINRRMALALKSGGARRAATRPATACDNGRIQGFWDDWSITMRHCSAPFAAREADRYGTVHKFTPPWDQVAASVSFIEFWGDHDDNMDHFDDYMFVLEEVVANFPRCNVIGGDGKIAVANGEFV